MRLTFEQQSTATYLYPAEKQTLVQHEGRSYQKIGKSYQALSSNERFQRVLSLVAKIAFAFLLIPLASASYRQSLSLLAKEIRTGREKIVHHIPVQEDNGSETPLNAMTFHMQNGWRHLNRPYVQAADCFIKMRFENGEIKREFILKNTDGSPISQEQFNYHTDAIRQHMQSAIESEFGKYQAIEWLILSKDAGQSYRQIHGNASIRGTTNYSGEGVAGKREALNLTLMSLQDMEFPAKNRFVQDGEFVPGACYQPL